MLLKDIVPLKSPTGKRRMTDGKWAQQFATFLVTQCGWKIIDRIAANITVIDAVLKNSCLNFSHLISDITNGDCFVLIEHPSLTDVFAFFTNDCMIEFMHKSNPKESFYEVYVSELQELEVDQTNGLLVNNGLVAIRLI